MIFVLSDQRATLELPSSVLPREALTLLYIGGASSSSSLLSCQETDGANEARMDIFFRGHRCGNPDGKGIHVKNPIGKSVKSDWKCFG